MTAASEKISEAYADKSDEWVAGRVRMLMRNDLEFEPILVAGRDRILRLSRELLQLRAEHETARKLLDESVGVLEQLKAHQDVMWITHVNNLDETIAYFRAAQGAARGNG